MLLALVAAGVLAWQGVGLIQSARDALATRLEQVTRDRVPTEPDPARISGPIPDRGLLLRDDTAATSTPEGGERETIGKRQFVAILNAWPLKGEPTHYRIGGDRPYGWVKADAILPWKTRLVVRPPGSRLPLADQPGGQGSETAVAAGTPLPVLAIDAKSGSIRCQTWGSSAPWGEPGRAGWIRLAELPPESLEVLLTRKELVKLLGRAEGQPSPDRRAVLAIVGRLGDGDSVAEADLAAARDLLRPVLDQVGQRDAASSARSLAERNENWRADFNVGGVAFCGVPLSILPVD